MKKRLCLFMISLLLFLSTGCSQTASQAPGALPGETPGSIAISTAAEPGTVDAAAVTGSDSADNSITASQPGQGDDLRTDNSPSDSGDTKESPPPGSSAAGNNSSLTESKPVSDNSDTGPESSSKENSLPDSSAAGSGLDSPDPDESGLSDLPEDGSYTSKEDVALYIHLYGHLPPNFITKKEAEKLGWKGGSLEPYTPGMCIGGSHFGNYEGLLPEKDGRSYTECDIDTLGAEKRGAKRIVFSNDGLIYYTEDHYASFELLYGDPDADP